MKATTTIVVIAIATLLCVSCTSAASDAPKVDKLGEVKASGEPQKTPIPDAKKQPTLQELQAQRTMMMLRIEGAETARNAIDKLIVDGRVAMGKLEEEIAKIQPNNTEPKPDKK